MGLKIGRGGRVAVATLLATLLLSLAFISAFKLGSQAQPTYSPCSCAACASASPGAASKTADVEWLNGSERASAVEKALSLEEFRKVASALEKLGYKPSPEKALAVRFEREVVKRCAKCSEVKVELVKHLAVAVPFEGGGREKFAFVIALLEPSAEALAFELDLRERAMKLVAREPANWPSLILPRAERTAQRQATIGIESSGCTSPQPNCGYCRIAICECQNWNYYCLIYAGIWVCGTICGSLCWEAYNEPTWENIAKCIGCVFLACLYSISTCCNYWGWGCYDCKRGAQCYEECCYTCDECIYAVNC
jgi:hypothetical protein